MNRKTVASRVKRLTDAGLGLPLTLGVDPSRLGIARAKVDLEKAKSTDQDAIEALEHVEGVQTILGYADGFDVIIHAENDSSLRSRVEVARRLVGAERVHWDIHSTRDFPKQDPYELTPLDSRLLAAMLVDARQPFSRISSALGVRTRTLERRFARLSEDGVVTMLPAGDGHSDFAGMIVTNVIVDLEGDDTRRRTAIKELLRIFPNHFVRNLIPQGRAHLLLYSASAAELQAQFRAARQLDGVKEITARTVIWIGANPRYQAWLANVLERWAVRPGAA